MKTLVISFFLFLIFFSASASKWHNAQIEISNGEKLDGKISIIGSRPLTITPAGQKYQKKILLSDILYLRQIIKDKNMNSPWLYKEAGKVEKMYLEGKYPFLNFTTEILLTNGEVIRGDIVSAAFKFKGSVSQKIFLTRQIKGKVGEKFEDIVYPERIKFDNYETIVEPIVINVKNAGKLQEATALDNQREVVHFGKIQGSKIIFDELFEADYDIYILTDTDVLGGLSASVPKDSAGQPLPSDALTELNKVLPLADDFFNERWILALNGNKSFCKTLIYKRREKYYASEKHTPGGWMWHLDIWSWHLAGKEWKIDRRYIMLRHKQKGDEKTRALSILEKLGAVKPGTELNIDLNKDDKNGIKFIRKLK
jgi:hypothetical protein